MNYFLGLALCKVLHYFQVGQPKKRSQNSVWQKIKFRCKNRGQSSCSAEQLQCLLLEKI